MSMMKYITVGVKYGIPDVTLNDSSVGDDGSLRFREEKSYLRLLGIVFSFKEILLKLIEGSCSLHEFPVVSSHI